MNIRELDEESRRTGVWPPRRIILRVEREDDVAETPPDVPRSAPVKVAEVDLNAPRPAAPPPKPRAPATLPAPSLAPSVTPSRRPGLPGARGVTPAPAASREEAEFDEWVASPLPTTVAEPEFQAPPAWLPDDLRVRAERRHRRVARKGRTQLFGASAATTLAVGGCAALVALVGLSQTESVGGAVGVPSIGLFGSAPEPPSRNDTAKSEPAKPAAKQPARTERRRSSARRTSRSASPSPSPSSSSLARESSPTSAPARRSSRRSGARAPAAPARRQQAPSQTRAPSPPPPPARVNPPPPPPAPPRQSAPVVWDAPSQPANSNPAPSRPATSAPAPSRPATSPAPTTSSPAP